jgi:hypothetical protein
MPRVKKLIDKQKRLAKLTLRDVLISYFQGLAQKSDVSAVVRLAKFHGMTRTQIDRVYDDAEQIARAIAISEMFGRPKRGYAARR